MLQCSVFWGRCLTLAGLLLVLLVPGLGARAAPLPVEVGDLSPDERWRMVRGAAATFAPGPTHWRTVETPSFRFHVLPDTAAERDLAAIMDEAQASLARISTRLDLSFDGTLDVYLIERVFWQGAAVYGGQYVLISYLDRNYVDIPLSLYFDHELTHALAFTLIPEEGQGASLLSEGLAVWATGGHYGPEPIHAMAAALPEMGQLVPLPALLDDFYGAQHEVAYIQAASFVGWLIEREGLERFKAFYGDAARPERHYDAGYDGLEQEWLAWLAREWGDEAVRGRAWWEAQIRFFDLMRAYGEQWDPVARILPDAPPSWNAPLRRQYQNNEDGALNIAVESQLIAASEQLSCRDDPAASQVLLDEVAAALAAGRVDRPGPLAARHAVAERLVGQAEALQRLDRTALTAGAVPEAAARLARLLDEMAPNGPVRQESARLDLSGDRAVARVVWHSEIGRIARPFELEFELRDEKWWLADVRPLRVDELVPRSSRLCNRWPLVSTTSPPIGG